MKLIYTTEKSEKETSTLFLRRQCKQESIRGMLLLSVLAWLFAGCVCLGCMLAPCSTIVKFPVALASFFTGMSFVCFLGLKIHERLVQNSYRRRKTNRVEYRLTDSALAFTVGDASFSLTWRKVATHYRLENEALFLWNRRFFGGLFGGKLPFEARCIPDWQGHGVKQEELVGALEKAGLKKSHDKLVMRILPFFVFLEVVALFGFMGTRTISAAWMDFRKQSVCAELNRAFYQTVAEGTKESDNPYSNYWEKRGNFVQRFVARRMPPFSFGKIEYFFVDRGTPQELKVGIATTIGDRVFIVERSGANILSDLPIVYAWDVSCDQWRIILAEWEKKDESTKIYPASARAEWLEKVRPLVPELRRVTKGRLEGRSKQ